MADSDIIVSLHLVIPLISMGVNYAKKRFMKLRPGELTGWRCTAPRPCRRPTNNRVVKSRNKLERLQL